MRRPGVAALLIAACAGVLALAFAAARDARETAFTLGVVPAVVAAELEPGATACQAPVNVPADFDAVRLQVGTYGRPGPPLAVEVRSWESGRRLSGGRLSGGYPDVSQLAVPIDRVQNSRRVEVCLTNAGRRRVALYGNAAVAAAQTEARIDDGQLGTDLSLTFERQEPESLLSLIPDTFERASVFRPGWVGPWTFWVLAAALIAGLPVLLALALARAQDAPGPGAAPESGEIRADRAKKPQVPARAP